MIHPFVLSKATIVGMVMTDGYIMEAGISFKSFLGVQGIISISGSLKMYIGKVREVIQEHGGSTVPAPSETPLDLGKETRGKTFNLVNRDAFAGLRGGVNLATIGSSLNRPWLPRHVAVLARRTHGRTYQSEMIRNNAEVRKKAENLERTVSKAVVPTE